MVRSLSFLSPTHNITTTTFFPQLPGIAVFIMDRRTPYTLSVLAPSTAGADESRTLTEGRLRDFVLEFQLDNAFIYRYVAALREPSQALTRLPVINYGRMPS